MSEFVLSCCSTVDLSAEHLSSKNISYLCFNFYLDDVSYKDDLGQTISYPEFYQKMTDGADTRTSQINVEEYYEYFETFLKEGKDVLHLTLSSGLSGTYNSARIAAGELREKYPDRKLYVVDSLAASSGYGLFMDKLADLRDEGMEIDELRDWAEKNRLRLHHWFFSTDLTFYVKGGRVSKVSGWFGTALKICPLLNVDKNGKLIPRAKLRGKPAVVKAIFEKMQNFAKDRDGYNEKCYMSHSDCIDDAKAVADLVTKNYKKLDGEVEINYIGTTIGSHTGPGTVALFFWGDERED